MWLANAIPDNPITIILPITLKQYFHEESLTSSNSKNKNCQNGQIKTSTQSCNGTDYIRITITNPSVNPQKFPEQTVHMKPLPLANSTKLYYIKD